MPPSSPSFCDYLSDSFSGGHVLALKSRKIRGEEGRTEHRGGGGPLSCLPPRCWLSRLDLKIERGRQDNSAPGARLPKQSFHQRHTPPHTGVCSARRQTARFDSGCRSSCSSQFLRFLPSAFTLLASNHHPVKNVLAFSLQHLAFVPPPSCGDSARGQAGIFVFMSEINLHFHSRRPVAPCPFT